MEIEVNLKRGTGKCYVNIAVNFAHLLRRSIVNWHYYELREKEWKCVSYKDIKGIDMPGPYSVGLLAKGVAMPNADY